MVKTTWKWISVLALAVSSHVASSAVPKKLNAFSEGDRIVYTRLVDAYRKENLSEVVKQRELLERNYPQSVHLDNAYYLTGMLEFQRELFGEALRSFNTVTSRFPKSNKRPAALFGKAMTYKRLNLTPQAVGVLSSIAKEYPGSPESKRAWIHLQMEKGSASKVVRQ